MRGKILQIIIVSALACGCSALTKMQTIKPFNPEDAGYKGDAKILFYYTEGVKALSLAGNAQQAAQLQNQVLLLDSTFAPAYYELATMYSNFDPPKAIEYSLKANQLDSANIWFKSQLGQLYVTNQEFGKAINIYENLAQETPQEPGNYRVLAALHQQLGQVFTAITILDSAEYKLGRIEELAAYKLQLLTAVKLYDRAIGETKALINDFPYNYENYLSLAQLYASTNKDSLALENYAKAQELSPSNIDIIASLNDYYKERKDIPNFLSTTKQLFMLSEINAPEKIKFFNEITQDREMYARNLLRINELAAELLTMYPNNIDIIKLYAQNQIAQGQLDAALTTYKSYIRPDSSHLDVFRNVIDIETYLNRADSVSKYTNMAIATYPNNSELYIRKGGSLAYMKQNKAAIEAYTEGYRYAENDSVRSVIYGIIGDTHYQDGDKQTGYKLYKKALKLDPDNVMVLNNYAYFLSEEGKDLDLALKMAEKVVELTSGNSTYLDTYAWVLHKMGDNQKAKKIMQQAISLDKHQGKELFLHYGDILHALGEDYMATIYWQKALEAGYDAQEVEKRLSKTK